MDVIIVAGVSKTKGSQFSLKKDYILTRDGMVMSYGNLRKIFGSVSNNLSDYSTPYLAGIYLYNYLSRRGISCGLINFLDLETKQFEKIWNKTLRLLLYPLLF